MPSNVNLTRDVAVSLIRGGAVLCPCCKKKPSFPDTGTKTKTWSLSALPAKRSTTLAGFYSVALAPLTPIYVPCYNNSDRSEVRP